MHLFLNVHGNMFQCNYFAAHRSKKGGAQKMPNGKNPKAQNRNNCTKCFLCCQLQTTHRIQWERTLVSGMEYLWPERGAAKIKKKRKNSRNRTSLVAIAITHTMVDYRLCRAAWHGLLLIIPRCVIIDFSLTLRGRQSAGEKKIKTGGKKTCKRLRVAKRGPRMWMCGPHFELRQAAGPRPDPVGRLAAGKTPSRLSPLWQLVGGVCAYLLINILHFDAWG